MFSVRCVIFQQENIIPVCTHTWPATLGNHDYFPHNQFPDHGNELYNRSFERWKSWIDESNSDTFLKGEYYAKICIGFLREIFYKAMQEIDRICGVTVSMLSRSAVDRGFKTRTG
jgi:hypothetical protein